MKRILFLLFALSATVVANAAINAQYNFEKEFPHFISVNGNATLEHSAEKYKDGAKSVKLIWNGPIEVLFKNCTDIERSMNVKSAGFMMWVYNVTPIKDPIRFSIKDWSDAEICHFDFYADFTGWRAVWIRYADMRTADGYMLDIPFRQWNKSAAYMVMKFPESAASGTMYFDRLSFTMSKMPDRVTPDMQIPDNNYTYRSAMWQWERLWEWEQYPKSKEESLGQSQKDMLRKVEARIDEWAKRGNSSASYVASTLLPRVDGYFNKYGIKRLPDGSVIGAPLLSTDEFNHGLGEMRIKFIQEIVYWSAQDYLSTGSKSSVQRVIDAMDHAIDQGFAYGSGMGTNHHYGYDIRDLYKGIWILRKPLAEAGKLDEYVKMLTYWSGLQETRMPYESVRDGILDAWHVLNNAKVLSAMMQPTDEQKYACMKALGEWVSGSLSYTDGSLGGIKVDGTSFHHGGHYPAYSKGAFAVLGDYCWFTEGTDFVINEPARRVFKHTLLTMDDYTNLCDWGIGVCGRHPFDGSIPNADILAYGRLALLGDLTGSGQEVDHELGGAYLNLGGKDKTVTARLKAAGVKPAAPKEGFRVYNYGGFGIHRRADWMLTLKGFNSIVWSSEIYAADNRYGRYLSYASAQLIGVEGALKSGYTQEGWDWNRYPGVTSVHLPFDLLENPRKGTLMERNDSRFPGVSSLEGMNGCLAFTLVERDRPNFCAGASVTASVFCFDNRIIHVGTGITNTSTYPTETTLYQLRLENDFDAVIIGKTPTDEFPYIYRHEKEGQVCLTDTKGNLYVVKNGNGLVVEKKIQSSPSDTKKSTGEGMFITAYLNHGKSPVEASYEYMMVVKANSKEKSKYNKELPYSVLQADNSAHVVKDLITGITAYISYKGYKSDATLVAEMPEEVIVMERTKPEGDVVMSICTPDLGITEEGYTTSQPSQPLLKTVTLNGMWRLKNEMSNVTVTSDGGNTIITSTCIHGQPVEFNLVK